MYDAAAKQWNSISWLHCGRVILANGVQAGSGTKIEFPQSLTNSTDFGPHERSFLWFGDGLCQVQRIVPLVWRRSFDQAEAVSLARAATP